jgi:hypothetical protein
MIRVDVTIDHIVNLLLWPGRWLCGRRGHTWQYSLAGTRGRCVDCGDWQ